MPTSEHSMDGWAEDTTAWLMSTLSGGLFGNSKQRDDQAGGFNPGDRIASLPQRCVLSARSAEESALGVAVRAAAASMGPTCAALCTEEVVLWVFMAVGRVDTAHPWHPYLASLPAESPEPTCWPQALRDGLASTPVGASVQAARDAVEKLYTLVQFSMVQAF